MDAFEVFLSAYPPTVKSLAKKTKTLIQKTIPDATEYVDTTSKIIAYGFSPKYAELVCAIAPYKTYVNLMFSKGTKLPNPEQLLTGMGKSARHIKIEDDKVLENPALKALIQQAVLLTRKTSRSSCFSSG